MSLGNVLLVQPGIVPGRSAKFGLDHRLGKLGNEGKAFLGRQGIDGIGNGVAVDAGALDQRELDLLARLQGLALALQQQIHALAFLLVVAGHIVAME